MSEFHDYDEEEEEEEKEYQRSGLRQALPLADITSTNGEGKEYTYTHESMNSEVEGEVEVDWSVFPDNAYEYLRRVHMEAHKYDQTITVASVPSQVDGGDDDREDKTNNYGASNAARRPIVDILESEWAQQAVSWFSELRIRAERWKTTKMDGNESVNRPLPLPLPHMNDRRKWVDFCKRNGPLLVFLKKMDQITIVSVLTYLIEGWSCEEHGKSQDMISSRWIFALLSILEKPLQSSTEASLQELAKAIRRYLNLNEDEDESEVYAHVSSGGHGEGEGEGENGRFFHACIVLSVVVERYFGQRVI